MIEPIWILEETVIDVHFEQIVEHGGLDGVRDQGLLHSALARPKNKWGYSKEFTINLPTLAASYGFAIIKNHPFLDGNKRVGLLVSLLFLELNGLKITAPPIEIYKVIMRIAEGNLIEEEFANWIAEKC